MVGDLKWPPGLLLTHSANLARFMPPYILFIEALPEGVLSLLFPVWSDTTNEVVDFLVLWLPRGCSVLRQSK